MQYKVPDKWFFRIHHVRPRFKDDIESVLLFMAESLSRVKRCPNKEFVEQVNQAIYDFPGNANKSKKTIDNWRTEISALFGFIDHGDGCSAPAQRAIELAQSHDVVKSFKTFLFNFQYPGAHIKAQEIQKQIEAGIHFKPAHYILQVLLRANGQDMTIGITKEEACHCIFNDLRATTGEEGPEATWNRIRMNRGCRMSYDGSGDVIRYAGDVIDYLEFANLLKTYDGKMYYLNKLEMTTILAFCRSTEWFSAYDRMIRRRSASLPEIKAQERAWFSYVNRPMAGTDFSTDILSLISSNETELADLRKQSAEIEKFILENGDAMSTGEIGGIGESLVYGHECMRLKINGREDLIHLVKRIPSQFAVGYDVSSMETNGLKRYIEVKTTISSHPVVFNRFHLTPNEWSTAASNGERYYVYRLMVNKKDRKLFLLQDPVTQYKQSRISMVPNDGADIVFDPGKIGQYEELLTWGS